MLQPGPIWVTVSAGYYGPGPAEATDPQEAHPACMMLTQHRQQHPCHLLLWRPGPQQHPHHSAPQESVPWSQAPAGKHSNVQAGNRDRVV